MRGKVMPTTGIGHEITLWHPYAFVRDSPQILLTSRFMATGVYGNESLTESPQSIHQEGWICT